MWCCHSYKTKTPAHWDSVILWGGWRWRWMKHLCLLIPNSIDIYSILVCTFVHICVSWQSFDLNASSPRSALASLLSEPRTRGHSQKLVFSSCEVRDPSGHMVAAALSVMYSIICCYLYPWSEALNPLLNATLYIYILFSSSSKYQALSHSISPSRHD